MISTTAPSKVTPFQTLGLHPLLIDTLAELGYQEPTTVQRQVIPPLVAGRDLVGQSGTGTGKTAAFSLPLLHRLAAPETNRTQPTSLILVPTRELAMQVAKAIHRYGQAVQAKVLAIYGGQAMELQLRSLKRGVDIVVATPGLAHDHLRRGALHLNGITAVVLDEADEMLEMGFAEDMEALLGKTPRDRQTMLFSATLSERVTAIAQRHLRNPLTIKVKRDKVEAGTAPKVRQTAYLVDRVHKPAALGRILDVEKPVAALVFCRTRTEVDELAVMLGGRGYRAETLHGGMAQEMRDRVMRRFRERGASLLIATDVAARGLDIEHLSHVVNYHLPESGESYVHRIGRVGRAGREGVAINLAEPRERKHLRNIEKVVGQQIQILPLPTVADLSNRRLEITRDALRAAIVEEGLESFQGVVTALTAEFEPYVIAAAAVKLLHRASGVQDKLEEIPIPKTTREPDFQRQKRKQPRSAARRFGPAAPTARIYVGAGREAGIVARDLVGAIANEAGVDGRDITGIEIASRFSLVEVPEEVVDYVIDSLRGSRIRGKKVTIRHDHGEG